MRLTTKPKITKLSELSIETYKRMTIGANPLISDQLPSALITYYDYYHDIEILELQEGLFAFVGYEYEEGHKKFLTISGNPETPINTKMAQYIRDFAVKNQVKDIQYLPEEWATSIARKLKLDAPVQMDPSSLEYIYSTQEQVQMEGGRFADRRWRKNKFDKLYGDHITLKVVDGQIGLHLKEVVGLFQDWKNFHTQGSFDYHTEIPAFNIFANNGLIGSASEIVTILLYYKDKLIAFSTIEILSPTSATCYFQKSNLNITSINDYFFHAVNQYLLSRNIMIYNYQEDAEIEGLAQYKKRLLPTCMSTKFQISLD